MLNVTEGGVPSPPSGTKYEDKKRTMIYLLIRTLLLLTVIIVIIRSIYLMEQISRIEEAIKDAIKDAGANLEDYDDIYQAIIDKIDENDIDCEYFQAYDEAYDYIITKRTN